jgi:cell division septum initiation protein DivIVA
MGEMIIAALNEIRTKIANFEQQNLSLREENERMKRWLQAKAKKDSSAPLEELLITIDTAENPLRQELTDEKMATTVVMAELSVLLSQAKGILKLDDGEIPQSMPQQRLSRYSRTIIEKLHDYFENSSQQIENQTRQISQTEDRLWQIYDSLVHFLGRAKASSERPVLNLVTELVDELLNPDNFVLTDRLNELTAWIRTELGIDKQIGPLQYIPQILDYSTALRRAIATIKSFQDPLIQIFRDFDFQFSSYDPNGPQFDLLRRHMLALHETMKQHVTGETLPPVALVLTRMVSLTSALFGYINMIGGADWDPP